MNLSLGGLGVWIPPAPLELLDRDITPSVASATAVLFVTYVSNDPFIASAWCTVVAVVWDSCLRRRDVLACRV